MKTAAEPLPKTERRCRLIRLLWLVQSIRNHPQQSLQSLLERAGISRSQYYKDRRALHALGFCFEYKTAKGFHITQDQLFKDLDLTLSDRLLLIAALRVLYESGDGFLVSRAVEIGRKLASQLDDIFRAQLLCELGRVAFRFDYGCKPDILEPLEEAIAKRRRINIIYDHGDGTPADRLTLDPLHLYFRNRALFLYARCPGLEPAHRPFRVSRIRAMEETSILFAPSAFNDDFSPS